MSPRRTDAWSRADPRALRTSTHAPRAPIAPPGRPDESRGRFRAGAASRCGAPSRARDAATHLDLVVEQHRALAIGLRHREAHDLDDARWELQPKLARRGPPVPAGSGPAARRASVGGRRREVARARAAPSRGCAAARSVPARHGRADTHTDHRRPPGRTTTRHPARPARPRCDPRPARATRRGARVRTTHAVRPALEAPRARRGGGPPPRR